MPAAAPSANLVPLGLLFTAMATVIMWFSAGVVGVTKPGLGRSFLATLGISVIVGAVFTAMSAFGAAAAIALAVAGLIACVLVIRTVFRLPTLPAFLILVVNVMVQMLLLALYLRPFLHAPAHK
jgi:hypothetical protein